MFAITGRTVGIEPLIGNSNAKFDGRKFNWIRHRECRIHDLPVLAIGLMMIRARHCCGRATDA
jgi:hypothetical protein